MHSTSNPKQADPDADGLVTSVPEGLAKAIAQVSKLEREPVRYPLDPKIPMNTFRPTVPRDRPARRGLIGLILAACIFVAAFALQSSYGDAVRPIIARWAPQFVPTAAHVPPELAQLLQTMMRDLANVEQEIKQLKTSQEEMARDSAKVAEQVKASQEQVARLMAKANEQKPAPPARPIATPSREPARTLPSPQATTKPQAPPQPQAEKP